MKGPNVAVIFGGELLVLLMSVGGLPLGPEQPRPKTSMCYKCERCPYVDRTTDACLTSGACVIRRMSKDPRDVVRNCIEMEPTLQCLLLPSDPRVCTVCSGNFCNDARRRGAPRRLSLPLFVSLSLAFRGVA